MTVAEPIRGTVRARGGLELVIAVGLVATTAALPLVFVPGLDDGYALPKAVLLRLAGVAIAMALVLYLAVGGSLVWRRDRWIDLALALFVTLTAVSTLTSVDVGQSIFGEAFQYQGLVTVLLYVGAFYVARSTLRSPGHFRALAITHVAIGAVVAAYAIAQTIGVDPFWSGPPEDRAISSVGQANDLAAYLDLVIVLGLGLWGRAEPRARTLIASVIVLSIIGLALTLSRGGFLALVAVGILLLAFRRPTSAAAIRLSPRVVLGGAVALAMAALLAWPLVAPVVERAGTAGDLQEGSIRMHLDSWRVGLAVAADHPLFGTGPETFPLVFADYLDGVLPPDRADNLRRFRLESPHDAWIGIAAESGIPALVAYLVVLGGLSARFARRGASGDGLSSTIAITALGALVIHVITTAFKTPDASTSLLFWVVVGSGLAASDPEDGQDQATTGPPVDASRSTRSAARTVPDDALIRADIASMRARRAPSARSASIAPVSSASSKP
jgi:O-antigen ligase